MDKLMNRQYNTDIYQWVALPSLYVEYLRGTSLERLLKRIPALYNVKHRTQLTRIFSRHKGYNAARKYNESRSHAFRESGNDYWIDEPRLSRIAHNESCHKSLQYNEALDYGENRTGYRQQGNLRYALPLTPDELETQPLRLPFFKLLVDSIVLSLSLIV